MVAGLSSALCTEWRGLIVWSWAVVSFTFIVQYCLFVGLFISASSSPGTGFGTLSEPVVSAEGIKNDVNLGDSMVSLLSSSKEPSGADLLQLGRRGGLQVWFSQSSFSLEVLCTFGCLCQEHAPLHLPIAFLLALQVHPGHNAPKKPSHEYAVVKFLVKMPTVHLVLL